MSKIAHECWTIRAESRRSTLSLGDTAKTSASAPHDSETRLLFSFFQKYRTLTWAAGPVHALAALKAASNETFCLGP